MSRLSAPGQTVDMILWTIHCIRLQFWLMCISLLSWRRKKKHKTVKYGNFSNRLPCWTAPRCIEEKKICEVSLLLFLLSIYNHYLIGSWLLLSGAVWLSGWKQAGRRLRAVRKTALLLLNLSDAIETLTDWRGAHSSRHAECKLWC